MQARAAQLAQGRLGPAVHELGAELDRTAARERGPGAAPQPASGLEQEERGPGAGEFGGRRESGGPPSDDDGVEHEPKIARLGPPDNNGEVPGRRLATLST